MPKRHDNIIYKLFLRSKTIIVTPSNITRTGPIIYIEDPEEAPSIDHVHVEADTKVEGTTIADIITTGHPAGNNIISVINLNASQASI